MIKAAHGRRRKYEPVAEAATVTLTADEATAMISGIGVAIRYEEVPEDIAPDLARALEKFDVAFGFGITPKEEGK